MLNKTFCAALLACHCLALSTQAQHTPMDSLAADPAFTFALGQYHLYLDPEPSLYRGPQYVEYGYLLKKGHPWFGDGQMHQGQIRYDSILYAGLSLSYDEVTDQVVINDPYESYKIALISELISQFTIGNHLFVRLTDSLNPSAPKNGFYEQLYKGRTTLLKKEKKNIRKDESSEKEGVTQYILSNTSWYLKKGTVYYPVDNKNMVLTALSDKNKELKAYIRNNDLDLKKDKDNALIKILTWYDNQK
jgi:hypothetical protein